MEAVPRLHMLRFPSKNSPEGTSFGNLKKYIAEFYQEDPESYAKEVFTLETLRNLAVNSSKDKCTILKRYYCQLHSLQNRFPKLRELTLFKFVWKPLYGNRVQQFNDIRFEQAIILYNIAAAHTQAGAAVTRDNADGMKLACTHFQCAAWAYGEILERYGSLRNNAQDVPDVFTPELLLFMKHLSLAQAQECILEKSLIDNRKPNIVAKVTAQIVVYYGSALADLLTGGEDGPIGAIVENSVYKLWKKYVRFKISYLNCILYLHQGQHAEEQKKMGECVTLYEVAWEKLEEARKESKNLPNQNEIIDSLTFTGDVVEGKRKNAKNENEFIYHEAVPELSTIAAIQGADLVSGIPFSVSDPNVIGEDIFSRLVPMKAHEASSLYSEEKAKLLRKYSNKIEEKDKELETYMNSLSLENLNINEEKANKIPQGIVDRCATLNAKKDTIPELEASMKQLTNICADVNINIEEIGTILAKESKEEKEFQQLSGVQRSPNAHITELTREYQKYNEAHQKASESNDTLEKAIEMHISNLKILSKPLKDIQQSVPKLSSELNTADVFQDVKLIVNKVNEMKAQRSQFHADLRIAVNEDDITSKIINQDSGESHEALFEREIAKHERLTQLIDQNLMAQDNILKALTEAYAKAAPVLRTLADVKHKRETFFISLSASYDVYEDLLSKSGKGLEFYTKLSGNVQKLLSRCKSARDVQSEERQQRLLGVSGVAAAHANSIQVNTLSGGSQPTQSVPKLRDYLKNKIDVKSGTHMPPSMATHVTGGQFIPSIRPNPLGSETPTKALCQQTSYYPIVSSMATANVTPPAVGPNEPPPPYSLQHIPYRGQTPGGLNAPMFLPYRQSIAPPAYKLQASPNSQFTAFGANVAVMNTLQHQMQNNANYGSVPMEGQNSSYLTPVMKQQQQLQQFQTRSTVPVLPQNSALPSTSLVQQLPIPQSSIFQPNPNSFQAATNKVQQPIHISTQMTQTSLHYQQQANNIPLGQPTHGAVNPYIQQQPSSVIQPQNLMTHSTMPMQPTAPMALNNSTIGEAMAPQPVLNKSTLASATNGPPNSAATFAFSSIHPGYSYNTQTGKYDYGSGYLQQPVQQVYSHYSSAPQGNMQTKLQPPNTGAVPDVNVSKHLSIPNVIEGGIISHTKLSKANILPGQTLPITSSNNEMNTGNTRVIYYNTPNNSDKVAQTYYKNYGDQQQTTHVPMPISTHAHNVAPTETSMTPLENPMQIPTDSQNINKTVNSSLPMIQSNHTRYTYTYIQSATANAAQTDTTKSSNAYATSAEQTPSDLKDNNAPNIASSQETKVPETTSVDIKTKSTETIVQKSNIDLLSDMDFSALNSPLGMGAEATKLPEPTLKPKVVSINPPTKSNIDKVIEDTTSIAAAAADNSQSKDVVSDLCIDKKTESISASNKLLVEDDKEVAAKVGENNESTKNKEELQPIATGNSNLDSIDCFQWYKDMLADDQKSATTKATQPIISLNPSTFSMVPKNPFTDDKVLKCFHKDVERYEKLIESLNVKMLNGHTPLSAKWKELQDLLERDAGTRSTTIGRLFPDKNRSVDCLPFDQARVKLDKSTDDYINAAYIKDLGAGCPNIIIAQTPQSNTNKDFWSMIWTEKAATILCLHTPGEMFDPFWPRNANSEVNFDDFTIRCVTTSSLTNCEQFHLTMSMTNSDVILELTLLQLKTWRKNTPSFVVHVADDAINAHRLSCTNVNSSSAPLIINCLTGSERSGLVAVAICTILATQQQRPLLINVVDVWHRICSQRQSSLRDVEMFEQSMQIVLNYAHDVLNKRGIMTSYQMKIAPQVTEQEKQATKDPLNELDALWKLK